MPGDSFPDRFEVWQAGCSSWKIHDQKVSMTNIYDRQAAISGGTLHHIGLLMQASERKAQALQHRCAWCDQENGSKPDPAGNESHGICQKHLAGMKANLETLRRQTAE
jgi:hypothetical protein